MKTKITKIALASILLTQQLQAIQIKNTAAPDVFGLNGENYHNNNANQDFAEIGIDIKQKGQTRNKCLTGFWTTVNWVGTLNDGTIVTDSLKENGNEQKLITLGASMTYKCLELALQQLHQGDLAIVKCPSHLVFGSKPQTSPLTQQTVPENSNVTFDLEVISCNVKPLKQDPHLYDQPKTTNMKPEQCMYLHLIESDNTALDLVLSTQSQDWNKKWPGKFAIFEEKVVDDPSQQWYYDETLGTLRNEANPGYYLDVQEGWAYIADFFSNKKKLRKDFPKQPRKWFYDQVIQGLTTEVNGISKQIAIWGQPKQNEWVEVGPTEELKDKASSKLKIEYCYLR